MDQEQRASWLAHMTQVVMDHVCVKAQT